MTLVSTYEITRNDDKSNGKEASDFDVSLIASSPSARYPSRLMLCHGRNKEAIFTSLCVCTDGRKNLHISNTIWKT
jgi:hypothetical protein